MPQPASNLRTIIILVAFLLLATTGTAYITYLLFSGGQAVVNNQEPASISESRPLGPTFETDTFTVNLRQGPGHIGAARYLRARLVLEASDQKVLEELETRAPQVRDRIIKILRSKTVEEINEPQAAERLQKEIIDQLNPLLNQGEVIDIYFTDLVVQ
ncbi:MAG: flagellar basal body-associated FliL family protein [Limnochordia bacterium]|jgi:flagellar FliL protein